MFQIFAETHKIIAESIYQEVFDIYNLKLDKRALERGSVLPDILPKYKLIRHYKDESLNYISGEIVRLIYASKYIEVNRLLNPIIINHLSKRIGIISHYLSDYVCLPHAKRWTFSNSMLKHLKYESKLNNHAKNHSFKKNMIYTDDIIIYDYDFYNLKNKVIEYINNVVDEYSIKIDLNNDMNYAFNINLKLTFFILDSIKAYNEIFNNQIIYEF